MASPTPFPAAWLLIGSSEAEPDYYALSDSGPGAWEWTLHGDYAMGDSGPGAWEWTSSGAYALSEGLEIIEV